MSKLNSWEIARLAGVSRSTVSRVINNYPNVPEDTRIKVMRIVNQYDYYPNVSGRVLAGKKTGIIGLFWASKDFIANDYLANYMMVSVIENAAAFKYRVLTSIVYDAKNPDEIRMIKEAFYQSMIDGGIFIGFSNNEPVIEDLVKEGFIVGILDQHIPGRREPNRIVVNFDSKTPERAIDYLVSLNHTKIGIINGDMEKYSGMQKYTGYLKAFKSHHIRLNKKWIGYSSFTEQSGYLCMKQILEQSSKLPTAICCADDSIAFGAISAIKDHGLQVPGDISVIGADDHFRSASFDPPLTTFMVDFKEMMGTLTKRVINVIKNEAGNSLKIMEFGSELVERASCKKI